MILQSRVTESTMTEVESNLFVGGYENASKVYTHYFDPVAEWYLDLNIDSVLCVAGEFVPYRIPEIDVLHLPIRCDDETENIVRFLDDAVQFVSENLHYGKRVLIHDRRGKSRTVCVYIAYLIARYRLSFHEAHEIAGNKISVQIYEPYLRQLFAHYERDDVVDKIQRLRI